MSGTTRLANERGQITDANPLQITGASGGGGDASAANQTTIIGEIGATTDAAATAGSTGSLNAKLRLGTTLWDAISTTLTSILATAGAAADAAVTAGATGSISAKLRSISRDLIANIVLAAGENLIGKVAGSAAVITPIWTVDTALYTAGDTVGTKQTLSNAVRVSGGSSILYQIVIADRANQKPTGSILIFNADPTAATTTDNAAFVFSTDDYKMVARIPVATADYVTINSKAVADLSNLGRLCKATTGTSLYAVFVTDGAPDFVLTTDFQIIFKFMPVD